MATVPGQSSKCANPKTGIPKHYGNTCTIWILPGIMVKPGLQLNMQTRKPESPPRFQAKNTKLNNRSSILELQEFLGEDSPRTPSTLVLVSPSRSKYPLCLP